MVSLANLHRQRVNKAGYRPDSHDKTIAPSGKPAERNQLYERLKLDLQHIETLQDYEVRNNYKQSRLAVYRGHAVQWVRSGNKTPNQIVSWFIVWLIDSGEIEEFSIFCPAAIESGQHCPEDFRRSLTEFFHDSIESWVRHQAQKGFNGKRPYLDRSLNRLRCGEKKDRINPVLEHKIWKLNAKLLDTFEKNSPESTREAIESCAKSLQVYPEAKVQTMLNRLTKRYEQLHPAGEPTVPQDESDLQTDTIAENQLRLAPGELEENGN